MTFLWQAEKVFLQHHQLEIEDLAKEPHAFQNSVQVEPEVFDQAAYNQ